MAASKTEQEIAEIAFAAGNIPGGYVVDPAGNPIVRKMTAEETRVAEAAVADEEAAAKRRQALLKRTDTPVVSTDPNVVPDAAR